MPRLGLQCVNHANHVFRLMNLIWRSGLFHLTQSAGYVHGYTELFPEYSSFIRMLLQMIVCVGVHALCHQHIDETYPYIIVIRQKNWDSPALQWINTNNRNIILKVYTILYLLVSYIITGLVYMSVYKASEHLWLRRCWYRFIIYYHTRVHWWC